VTDWQKKEDRLLDELSRCYKRIEVLESENESLMARLLDSMVTTEA
jgi:hypothetical protein